MWIVHTRWNATTDRNLINVNQWKISNFTNRFVFITEINIRIEQWKIIQLNKWKLLR